MPGLQLYGGAIGRSIWGSRDCNCLKHPKGHQLFTQGVSIIWIQTFSSFFLFHFLCLFKGFFIQQKCDACLWGKQTRRIRRIAQFHRKILPCLQLRGKKRRRGPSSSGNFNSLLRKLTYFSIKFLINCSIEKHDKVKELFWNRKKVITEELGRGSISRLQLATVGCKILPFFLPPRSS